MKLHKRMGGQHDGPPVSKAPTTEEKTSACQLSEIHYFEESGINILEGLFLLHRTDLLNLEIWKSGSRIVFRQRLQCAQSSRIATFHPQFFVNMLQMLLHSGTADAENDTGLEIGFVLRHPKQDFRLACGQAQLFQRNCAREVGLKTTLWLGAFQPGGDGFQRVGNAWRSNSRSWWFPSAVGTPVSLSLYRLWA